MDTKLVLIKCICMLYRERQLKSRPADNKELIERVLETIKDPEFVIETDNGRNVIRSLKDTIFWMMEQPVKVEFDRVDFLQRIRVNVGNDESLYKAIDESISAELKDKAIKSSVLSNRKELTTYLNRQTIKAIMKSDSNKVNFHENSIDWRHFINEHIERLQPFSRVEDQETNPHIVDEVSFDDIEGMSKIITRAKDELSASGVIRFGVQGINRMFGVNGGIRRGEFLISSGLPYNFKSGLNMTMLKGAALYNVPYMLDAGKKPMLLRLSIENDASNDILWLYKSLVENETKQLVDIRNVDPIQAGGYVMERLQATGYTIRLYHIDPTNFTYYDLFEIIDKHEMEGYEIHAVFCDYLNLIPKIGCTQGPAGTDIRDLFRRVRNYMLRKRIAFLTPHQLSNEAKLLLRMGSENFVKEVVGKGYYDGCRSLDQEADIEIHHHIVTNGNDSYLTVQRGKHRGVDTTPEKDRYAVFKFEEVGGIVDDINGRDLGRKHVGGDTVADSDGSAWFT